MKSSFQPHRCLQAIAQYLADENMTPANLYGLSASQLKGLVLGHVADGHHYIEEIMSERGLLPTKYNRYSLFTGNGKRISAEATKARIIRYFKVTRVKLPCNAQ